MEKYARSEASGSQKAISVTLPSSNHPRGSIEEPSPRQPPNSPRKGPTTQQTTQHGRPSSSGTQRDLEQMYAARVIERAWLSYRDRQMFQLLKNCITSAEHSMSYMILRKVCPREAAFFKDPCTQLRIRFRFGGTEFPPVIYFKVFTRGPGVKYVSGKKTIAPASEAARDAYDQMGARKFYDQLVQDTVQRQTRHVTDEVDVTTLRDYMQYLSSLDETPAELGGRGNTWRRLDLADAPRFTVFYDVLDFIYSHQMTPRLKQNLHVLASRPVTQELKRQQISLLTQVNTPAAPPPRLPTTARSETGRRSRQAKQRVSKMRQAYVGQPHQDGEMTAEILGEEDELDREADELYQWTQELSFDEIAAVATPRLAT